MGFWEAELSGRWFLGLDGTVAEREAGVRMLHQLRLLCLRFDATGEVQGVGIPLAQYSPAQRAKMMEVAEHMTRSPTGLVVPIPKKKADAIAKRMKETNARRKEAEEELLRITAERQLVVAIDCYGKHDAPGTWKELLEPLIEDHQEIKVVLAPKETEGRGGDQGKEGSGSSSSSSSSGGDTRAGHERDRAPPATPKKHTVVIEDDDTGEEDIFRIVKRAHEVRALLGRLQAKALDRGWTRVREIITDGLSDRRNWMQDPKEAIQERYDGRCRWPSCTEQFGSAQHEKLAHERNCIHRPVWAVPDLPKKKVPKGARNNGRSGKASADGLGVMATGIDIAATLGLEEFLAAELGAKNGTLTILESQWDGYAGVVAAASDVYEIEEWQRRVNLTVRHESILVDLKPATRYRGSATALMALYSHLRTVCRLKGGVWSPPPQLRGGPGRAATWRTDRHTQSSGTKTTGGGHPQTHEVRQRQRPEMVLRGRPGA